MIDKIENDIMASYESGSIIFSDPQDRVQRYYLLKDNLDWTDKGKLFSNFKKFKPLYKYKGSLLLVDKKDFVLSINPILNFEVAKETDNDDLLFKNTRGLELRGIISDKLAFHTTITENQARHPKYVQNYIFNSYLSLPFQNRFAAFRDNGVDYFNATGYISFQPIKNIDLTFGHDKHFFGNGYRSLFLSDFSGNYPFLKINTKLWKFEYTNLFTEFISQFKGNEGNVYGYADGERIRKYSAMHHLSLNITRKLNIGIFESIIFSRGNGYEINYLNPIIFYRSIENQIGGTDNVLLGFDFKWKAFKNSLFYGQLLLDEWRFSAIIENNGDWRNKNGFQLGFKTVDLLGVHSLDVQLEYNQVRPYTYSHSDTISNFTHYNQPLAHPLGANFRELVGIVNYQTRFKVNASLKTMVAQIGTDIGDLNYGNNLFLGYNTRFQDFNNDLLQGNKNDLFLSNLVVSYNFWHNMFFDLSYTFRENLSDDNSLDYKSHTFSAGLRVNIGRSDYLF